MQVTQDSRGPFSPFNNLPDPIAMGIKSCPSLLVYVSGHLMHVFLLRLQPELLQLTIPGSLPPGQTFAQSPVPQIPDSLIIHLVFARHLRGSGSLHLLIQTVQLLHIRCHSVWWLLDLS